MRDHKRKIIQRKTLLLFLLQGQGGGGKKEETIASILVQLGGKKGEDGNKKYEEGIKNPHTIFIQETRKGRSRVYNQYREYGFLLGSRRGCTDRLRERP